MSGLEVGNLYVLLSAKTSAFGKGMEDAAKLTEQVAKKIKRSMTEIGRAGTAIGLAVGAALAIAAQNNAAVASATRETKDIFNTFAGEIATMMLPAVKRLNELLKEMLGWWQHLSPATKEHVAHWVELATVVGLGALALGKVAGIVAAIAPAFEAIGGVLSLGATPLLAMVAAVVALGVVVAVLHKAWRENWGGIQNKTREAIEAMSGYWQSFKDWLSNNFFSWFIDQWASVEKAIAHASNFISNPFNVSRTTENGLENRDQANASSDAMIDAWAKRMKAGAMGDALKLAADKIKEGAGVVVDEWKLIGKQVKDVVTAALGFTGKPGTVVSSEQQAVNMLRHERISRIGDANDQGNMTAQGAAAYEAEVRRDQSLAVSSLIMVSQELDEELSIREFMNGQLQGMAEGLKIAGTSFLGKLGELGSTIQSVIQGAQQGGIWGAIAAVFVELLSQFKGFQRLMDIGQGQMMQFVQELTPVFNTILPMLRNFMGASGVLTQVVLKLLTPIFEVIGRVLGKLAPILSVIAMTLEVLQPLFDLLGMLLDMIVDTLGYVLRGVGVIILGVLQGLEAVWAMILDALLGVLQWVANALHTHDLDQAMLEISKAAVAAHGQEKKFGDQMKALFETGTTGLEGGAADAAESLGRLQRAADDATESLTNIPSGYKIAQAIYNASQGVSSSTGGPAYNSFADSEREYQAFRQTGSASAGSYRTRPGT